MNRRSIGEALTYFITVIICIIVSYMVGYNSSRVVYKYKYIPHTHIVTIYSPSYTDPKLANLRLDARKVCAAAAADYYSSNLNRTVVAQDKYYDDQYILETKYKIITPNLNYMKDSVC